MFGFSGGENVVTIGRKKVYLGEARRRWPFLTNFDASTIKNQHQLIMMVKDRSGVSRAAAEADVRAFAEGKQF